MELVIGLVVGTLFGVSLLVFGFFSGWKLRDRVGRVSGEVSFGDVIQHKLEDPITLSGFEPVEEPEED